MVCPLGWTAWAVTLEGLNWSPIWEVLEIQQREDSSGKGCHRHHLSFSLSFLRSAAVVFFRQQYCRAPWYLSR
jgi:hypothetical protein